MFILGNLNYILLQVLTQVLTEILPITKIITAYAEENAKKELVINESQITTTTKR